MKTEKKIFLNKLDDLNVAVDRVLGAEADKVILNLPRNSVLGSSVHNFQVLKREALAAGKEIVIESVDDHILELAGLAKISAANPVFKIKEKTVSDILPRANFAKKVDEVLSNKGQELDSLIDREIPKHPPAEEKIYPRRKTKKPHRKYGLKLLVIFLILSAALFWIANIVLPQVTVAIVLKKTPVDFKETVEVSTQIKNFDISGEKIILPGELISARRNLQMTFETHGKESVSTKARGTIIIYNAYSHEPQTLVAKTRFETPDKKIFRLDNQVTVPGAKIVNGKIQPSKIEAKVTADEPGEAYNIGPVAKWSIPGFKGTPRYEGFYAESLSPMTGGFVGERPYPTENDLTQAKAKLSASLKEALESQMILVSRDFKTLSGASDFKIIKEEVGPVDNSGKFSLFTDAEARRFIFNEEMLKNAVVAKSGRFLGENLRVKNFELNYGAPTVDFTSSKMVFTITGSVVFEPDLNTEQLKSNLAGKNEKEINATLTLLPGLERAKVALWPFWVNRVPKNVKKIIINVD